MLFCRCALILGLFATYCNSLSAQQGFPPVPEEQIRKLNAVRIDEPLKIDGSFSELAWQSADPSPPFVDLIRGTQTAYSTSVRVLWDDDYLYVGYAIEEPNVEAKFTKRDSPIYRENDVELFIAGEDGYYEFETNALGTIYEGMFIWQSNYEPSGISKLPAFDRNNPNVRHQRFNGVGFKEHPRGLRWAFLGWDYPGVKVAVDVQGTLNNEHDKDEGWTVELAFPWKPMAVLNLSKPRTLPPNVGDVWRMDFSRFNKYKIVPGASRNDEQSRLNDSGGWALSHHGVWDSHIPECFPFVTFVDQTQK